MGWINHTTNFEEHPVERDPVVQFARATSVIGQTLFSRNICCGRTVVSMMILLLLQDVRPNG